MTCADECAAEDEDCVNACVAHGSREAQGQLAEIGDCISNRGCEDWTCLQAECGALLDACINDGSGDDGGGGGGGVPQGTPLPEQIVGNWSTSDARALIQYSFTSDGVATGSSVLATGVDDCQSAWIANFVGVAQWANNTLSVLSTSGSQSTTDCSGNLSSTSLWSTEEHYDVLVGSDADGPTLQLTSAGNTVTYHRY